tara:strand:+ start:716 stop:1087 length:372 start_codon:yes stop_codon:yes gene_type:complete
MTNNNRRNPRLKTHRRAIVVRIGAIDENAVETNETLMCSLSDLSVNGTRLSVGSLIPKGSPVKVTIIFKNPACHFDLLGEVRWVSKSSEPNRWLTGIQFKKTPEGDLGAWETFLKQQFPDSFD